MDFPRLKYSTLIKFQDENSHFTEFYELNRGFRFFTTINFVDYHVEVHPLAIGDNKYVRISASKTDLNY